MSVTITNAHLNWFNLKCPYKINSPKYREAYAKLHGATYSDIEKLRAKFDEYQDGSTPVRHYKHKGKWYAKPLTGGTAQELNMKGIQRHGHKYRVQQRRRGQLRKWTYDTLKEAQKKRDVLFG